MARGHRSCCWVGAKEGSKPHTVKYGPLWRTLLFCFNWPINDPTVPPDEKLTGPLHQQPADWSPHQPEEPCRALASRVWPTRGFCNVICYPRVKLNENSSTTGLFFFSLVTFVQESLYVTGAISDGFISSFFSPFSLPPSLTLSIFPLRSCNLCLWNRQGE